MIETKILNIFPSRNPDSKTSSRNGGKYVEDNRWYIKWGIGKWRLNSIEDVSQ